MCRRDVLTYVFHIDVDMLARNISDADCITITSSAIRRNLMILCQADQFSGRGLSTRARRRVLKEKNSAGLTQSLTALSSIVWRYHRIYADSERIRVSLV